MNKFLTAVFAATLLSSTALAKDSTVTVPTPKSITIICSDDVSPGTVVLSNPPKFSCKDFTLVNSVIGTGITVGPDVNVDRIARAIRQATRSNSTDYRPKSYSTRGNRWVPPVTDTRKPELDDFDVPNPLFSKKFPGMNRNRKFFVSGTSSCRGWVPIYDIIEGKCREGKVKVE